MCQKVSYLTDFFKLDFQKFRISARQRMNQRSYGLSHEHSGCSCGLSRLPNEVIG